MNKEEIEIMEANFKAKSQIMLETGISRDFNGLHMTIKDKAIMIVQKDQTDKLLIIDIKDNTKKQQYVEYINCGNMPTEGYI